MIIYVHLHRAETIAGKREFRAFLVLGRNQLLSSDLSHPSLYPMFSLFTLLPRLGCRKFRYVAKQHCDSSTAIVVSYCSVSVKVSPVLIILIVDFGSYLKPRGLHCVSVQNTTIKDLSACRGAHSIYRVFTVYLVLLALQVHRVVLCFFNL